MFTRASPRLVVLTLLALSGNAAAQTWQAEGKAQETLRDEVAVSWPQALPAETQTFFSIRHNATDGTSVGMALRSASFPSFLLQLDVVPPGYGPPEEAAQTPVAPSQPLIEQKLRTVHKLSLRYRF
jgi:hypothetical protein